MCVGGGLAWQVCGRGPGLANVCVGGLAWHVCGGAWPGMCVWGGLAWHVCEVRGLIWHVCVEGGLAWHVCVWGVAWPDLAGSMDGGMLLLSSASCRRHASVCGQVPHNHINAA